MTTLTRSFSTQTPQWQRFQVEGSPYQRQYAHVYHQRLSMLASKIEVPDKVERVLDLKENVRAGVIGTLVKESAQKGEPVVEGSRCYPGDELFLEDSSGRVHLDTDQVHAFATGVVMGVVGVVGMDGSMKVECFVAPSIPVPQPKEVPSSYILLVSGLNCGEAPALPREMLLAYLDGQFKGGPNPAEISRVILAGGLVTTSTEGLRQLDSWTSRMAAAGLCLDIVPGEKDPTTANWPQRPLHSSLLPQTRKYKTVHRTPNPYQASFDGRVVMGTDGTNVRDLQSRILIDQQPASELDVLEKTLEWSHSCPTGPSSVPTVPHAETDPMVLSEPLDLYFAGNCTKFATKEVNGTRLVCVPSFETTGMAVLVQLGTMKVQVVRFED